MTLPDPIQMSFEWMRLGATARRYLPGGVQGVEYELRVQRAAEIAADEVTVHLNAYVLGRQLSSEPVRRSTQVPASWADHWRSERSWWRSDSVAHPLASWVLRHPRLGRLVARNPVGRWALRRPLVIWATRRWPVRTTARTLTVEAPWMETFPYSSLPLAPDMLGVPVLVQAAPAAYWDDEGW